MNRCGWETVVEVIKVERSGRCYSVKTESGRVLWPKRRFLRLFYPHWFDIDIYFSTSISFFLFFLLSWSVPQSQTPQGACVSMTATLNIMAAETFRALQSSASSWLSLPFQAKRCVWRVEGQGIRGACVSMTATLNIMAAETFRAFQSSASSWLSLPFQAKRCVWRVEMQGIRHNSGWKGKTTDFRGEKESCFPKVEHTWNWNVRRTKHL